MSTVVKLRPDVADAARQELSPESALKRLFRKEAKLEAALIELKRDIAAERRRYAAKHRLSFFPPVETLRRIFL